MPIIKNCLTCGKEFKTIPYSIKRGEGKFCSLKCRPLLSAQTRQKMSEAKSGEKNHNWKGGRKKTTDGYILIYTPDHPFCDGRGYVAEHRLVIEKQIGRYLTPDEVGHHRGKKNNNQPHGLMAFTSISAHIRFHRNPDNVKPNEIIFDGKSIS